MGLKFAVDEQKNLYDFWGGRLTQLLADEITASGSPFVLNVASQEYAKSVDLRALGVPVITALFPGWVPLPSSPSHSARRLPPLRPSRPQLHRRVANDR